MKDLLAMFGGASAGEKPEIRYACEACEDNGWVWADDDAVRQCEACAPSVSQVTGRTFS